MAAHEGKKELEIYIDRDTPVPGASGDKIICTTYAKLAMIHMRVPHAVLQRYIHENVLCQNLNRTAVK